MHNPQATLARLPGAARLGDRARPLPPEALVNHPALEEAISAVLTGDNNAPHQAQTMARQALRPCLGDIPDEGRGIFSDLFRAYASVSGDPDVDLDRGAPMGLQGLVRTRGFVHLPPQARLTILVDRPLLLHHSHTYGFMHEDILCSPPVATSTSAWMQACRRQLTRTSWPST